MQHKAKTRDQQTLTLVTNSLPSSDWSPIWNQQVPQQNSVLNSNSNYRANRNPSSHTIYKLVTINQATLTKEDQAAISEAPVVAATPAVINTDLQLSETATIRLSPLEDQPKLKQVQVEMLPCHVSDLVKPF